MDFFIIKVFWNNNMIKILKIILEGRPATKKNSQQIVMAGNKRRYVIQSKRYLEYENKCLWQLKARYHGETIKGKMAVKLLYWLKDKRLPDLLNLEEATCDILEKAKVIENDRNIYSFDGSRIIGMDKNNPRVEIYIEKKI